MIQQFLVKLLLSPIAFAYGFAIIVRNKLYQWGILRSTHFNIPVIGVGNLTLGGAGKTPHVEYLIRLLSPYLKIATLSRGYGRKSRGFKIVRPKMNASDVGDEPLQYFLKYPNIKVAVCESRSIGIPLLLNHHPEVNTVILDDSYQHLSVTPGINILLTEYSALYTDDYLLPVGRLREWKNGAKRANVIVVTKCPPSISQEERQVIINKIKPKEDQTVLFSKYVYGTPYNILNGSRLPLSAAKEVVLLTAIANESYLEDYLYESVAEVHNMAFEDHHYFSPHEVSLMKQLYDQVEPKEKVIITTEKDATRLILHRDYLVQHQLPVYVLPLQVSFLDEDGPIFNNLMKDFLMNFKA